MDPQRLSAVAGAALAALLLAAPPAHAELRVLAPPNGATTGETEVTLIGAATGSNLELNLNGKKVAGVKQFGKGFTAPLTLAAGVNVVTAKSSDGSLEMRLTHQPKAAGGTYRYHPPVLDGDCKACHPQGAGRTSPVSEARFCSACHEPKTGYKRLHGPLGAGQCSVCHDPHGSAQPRFLVEPVRELCVQCHAQLGSAAHIEKAGTKACTECHDAHGSDKQYLLH
jgi:predicted CXXCH cytochrome family protein